MTKVKICGMMREQDIELARKADFLGFVIESGTRRSLTIERARDLMESVDRKKVAVFISSDAASIIRMTIKLDPDVLQLHSRVSANVIREVSNEIDLPIWSLVPIGDGREERRVQEIRHEVDALLLDSLSSNLGGSGMAHDWSKSGRIREQVHPQPIVLSGGLKAENLREAISEVRPEVVDVSSGVEVKGLKDETLIDRFLEESGRI